MIPNLNQDPNLLTQQLLQNIALSLNNGSSLHLVPTVPEWTGPSATAIWVQSLLYASLACSLFAALAAVMGKQWLSHYSSVGERGGIEARGAERQRKFVGLQAWHLRTILEFIPILLQASLLFFGLGLSAFIYDQQHVVAAIAISVNGAGAIFYFVVVAISLWFPDCPFQTPLSAMLIRLLITAQTSSKAILLTTAVVTLTVSRHIHHFAITIFAPVLTTFSRVSALICDRMIRTRQLPRVGQTEGEIPLQDVEKNAPSEHSLHVPITTPVFTSNESGEVGKADHDATSAILWLLDSSTDPLVFAGIIQAIPEIYWTPAAIQLLPISLLDRLLGQIYACFGPRADDFSTLLFIDNNRDTAIAMTAAFLFVYWEKYAVDENEIKTWADTLGPQFAEDSQFDIAKRLQHSDEDELGKLFELLTWTLYHAAFLKKYASSKSDRTPLQSSPLLSIAYQTSTGLPALRIRTTFYLAQHPEHRISPISSEIHWDNRKHILGIIDRQANGASTQDLSATAIIACITIVTGGVPQLVKEMVLIQTPEK